MNRRYWSCRHETLGAAAMCDVGCTSTGTCMYNQNRRQPLAGIVAQTVALFLNAHLRHLKKNLPHILKSVHERVIER